MTHATIGAAVFNASKSISSTFVSVVSRLFKYAAISVPLRKTVDSADDGWTAKREVEDAREASRTVMTLGKEVEVIERGDTMHERNRYPNRY